MPEVLLMQSSGLSMPEKRTFVNRMEVIMFQVDDRIVYGTHGVCVVTAVGKLAMSMADKHKQYYTLCPIYQHDAVIYVPVDNHKIKMRPVLSKEEAEELIGEIPDLETIWIVNEREREVQYREALLSCDCRELIRIIKTLYQRKKSRVRDGKKVASVDERYFRQAEEQLYGELAYVLDMDKEEVEPYITEHMMKKSCSSGEKNS